MFFECVFWGVGHSRRFFNTLEQSHTILAYAGGSETGLLSRVNRKIGRCIGFGEGRLENARGRRTFL